VVREILQHLDADLYALIDFESVNPDSYLYKRTIGTTFLQQFPFARRGVQKYLPLLPLAIEQLDLRDYDVILSSSHTVAKGVLTRPDQMHLCYCHSPMRFIWDLTFDYLQASRLGQGVTGLFTRYLLHRLRQWDVIAANRVDYFVANSHHIARRIWRTYRREAQVIYPPVQIDRFTFQPHKQEFYLTVSRLVSYKKVELIVKAFNRLGRPLVVIGGGPELQKLQAIARPHVQILGFQPDAVVEQYMSEAKAFVYAACEDFGIALVEAQACGTPVITYAAGGAQETVRDLRQHPESGTGLFFTRQTEDALVEAIETFEQYSPTYNPESARQQAARFHPAMFQQQYFAYLDVCYQRFMATLRSV
jgi:glycosyltransferase involved in cell wall biosynthesis